MTNREKLFELTETSAHLCCCKCADSIIGYDADEVADKAEERGWHVTKSQNVYCEKCKRKGKKKSGN